MSFFWFEFVWTSISIFHVFERILNVLTIYTEYNSNEKSQRRRSMIQFYIIFRNRIANVPDINI